MNLQEGITHNVPCKQDPSATCDKGGQSLNRDKVTTKPSVILVHEAHRETENGQILTEKSHDEHTRRPRRICVMIALNTIYNENCLVTLDNMDDGEGFDVIITSPPYNTNVKANDKNNTQNVKVKEGQYTYARYDGYDDSKSNEEYCGFISNLFEKINMKMKPNGCVLWNASYGNENTDALFLSLNKIIEKGFSIADVICWKKNTAMPNTSSKNKATRICEFVFVICRKKEIVTFNSNKQISSVRTTGQLMYKPFTNYIEARNNDGSNPYNKATYSTELVSKLINLYVNRGG